MPTVEKPKLKFTGYQPVFTGVQSPPPGNEGGSPILPPGTTALTRNYAEHWRDAYNEVKYCFEEGMIPEAAMYELLEAMPSETLRELVRKIAGTDASFLMTFTKQVRLVDAVLNQLVYADGRLKETAAEAGISLKDALTMSTRISQMLIKDLPKLYTIDRIQRMEQAFGDVIDEFLDADLQEKVLTRLAELTKE